jgi:N-acetylglucosaminyldiphosphoundecaprenol N-acetyl-beta-D-mannosaminyltransferase
MTSSGGTAASARACPAEPVIELCGIRIDAITEQQCVERVLRALADGRGGWITTPNLDHLRRLAGDAEFRALCAPADLVVADGAPLVWASRLQRTPLPERVAGSDLISSLSAGAARAGRSVFLLGGDAGTAEGAAAVLRARHPELCIAGTHRPELGFERDPAQRTEIERILAAAAPDIVYVALGSPKQERVIAELRPLLPRTWWLGIGISFSFLTGDVRRAPPWMRKVGLEWTHRLAQEPKRLARRYLVDGLPFAARLLARSAWRGMTSAGMESRRPGSAP